MGRSSLFYAAVLIGLLIAVAYFTGLVSDANSIFTGLGGLVTKFQGINPQTGNFASYPAAG